MHADARYASAVRLVRILFLNLAVAIAKIVSASSAVPQHSF